MLITVEVAADVFGISLKNLYADPKFIPFIKNKEKRENVSMFDIDGFNELQNKKNKETNFCIDMVNFAEFVINIIGENVFFERIPSKKRQGIKRDFEKSKFSLSNAELIKVTFDQWYKSYEDYEITNEKPSYILLENRIPLSEDYVITNYWSRQKTSLEIAQELNVPEGWVLSEIKRLGLQKTKNGIIRKSGMKGKILSKEQREKRQNQPHAKPIVRICPKTFKILEEYNSQGAVERYGFKREGVRKAIKSGGLHFNFLWAYKGLEEATIRVVKKRGNLDIKLQASKFKRPTKDQLKKLYIDNKLTAKVCAKRFNCHKTTIAILATKYGLVKRTKKISINELKDLYINQKLQAKEIAEIYECKTSTISTYLSKNGIKRCS